MSVSRAAFTLLEICLTLLIAGVLILLAVPSVAGVLAERRLRESYAHFEHLVVAARWQSIKEQQPYRLLWGGHRVVVEPSRHAAGENPVVESLNFSDQEAYHLERVAALTKPAADEWTFWPDGTCEPVVISYQGPAGNWQARFDALTGGGTFLKSEAF